MVTQSPDEFLPLDLTDDATPLEAVDVQGGGLQPQLSLPGGVGSAVGSISDLMAVVGELISPLIAGLADVSGLSIDKLFSSAVQYVENGWRTIDVSSWLATLQQGAQPPPIPDDWHTYIGGADSVWNWVTTVSGGAFYSALLRLGLNVDMDNFDDQAQQGVRTTDQLIGFTMALPFILPAFQLAFKLLLGERFADRIMEGIKHLPEEMGLSWALGLTIEKGFESAVGESINRAIRKAKRPGEPEWPIVRTMLRQHVIADEKLQEVLENEGYSDDWITAIKALETQPLPVGDIQAMYQAGIIQAGSIDQFLIQLGFSDDVRPLIKQLYIEKAETVSGAEIRSVWRTLYRNGTVTRDQYIQKLKDVHFPDMLIADDVQAVDDELQYGYRQQSITVIKQEYLHGNLNDQTAPTRLQGLGYSLNDAKELVASWSLPPIPRSHGLTEAQILKYYQAGITLSPPADTQLRALGLNTAAINTLLNNPLNAVGQHPIRLTPALVTQAYLDGAIQDSELDTELRNAGATGEVLTHLAQVARYRYAHKKIPNSGNTPLTSGQILDAMEFGILTPQGAQTYLEALGYSPANALILTEIKNKGPFQTPQTPAFSSVQAALNYLSQYGVTIAEEEDPQFAAAVSMVQTAGYQLQYPAGFTPPMVIPPLPGSSGSGGAGQQPPTLPAG